VTLPFFMIVFSLFISIAFNLTWLAAWWLSFFADRQWYVALYWNHYGEAWFEGVLLHVVLVISVVMVFRHLKSLA
jgi:hypothetical protein